MRLETKRNKRRSCGVQDMRNEKLKYKERYTERKLKGKMERVSILWYSPVGWSGNNLFDERSCSPAPCYLWSVLEATRRSRSLDLKIIIPSSHMLSQMSVLFFFAIAGLKNIQHSILLSLIPNEQHYRKLSALLLETLLNYSSIRHFLQFLLPLFAFLTQVKVHWRSIRDILYKSQTRLEIL